MVVRYFGGVKLGVGGLIGAYKTAAENALDHALVIEREVFEKFRVEYDYGTTPEVMRLVKEFELQINEQRFDETCMMQIEVRLRLKESLLKKIALMNALGSEIKIFGD